MSAAVWKRKDRKAKPFFYKFQFRKKTVRKYGFDSKESAKEAEAKELLRLKALGSSEAFATVAEKRLAEIKAYSTPLWFINCRGILENFKDWNLLPVSDITHEMVRDRILSIAASRGNNVANRYLVVLNSVFATAIRDRVLRDNPVMGIRKFPVERKRKKIPRREDIDKVIALANPFDRAYLTTLLFTGARVGEINNLTWDDIDLERRTICLWTRKKKRGDKKPRTIQMVQRVYDCLISLERYTYSPWVFNNPAMVARYPFDPAKWRYIYRDRFLKTLCRDAKVPDFTFHTLRHYTASALDAAGVPLATIQRILGHERATTTDLYLQDLGKTENGLEVLE